MKTPINLAAVPNGIHESTPTPNLTKNRIGKAIREARLAHNLTQKELSEKIGINYNAACSWENGTKKVTPEIAEMLRKVLPLPDDLFEDVSALAKTKKSKGQRINKEVTDRLIKLRQKERYSMREMADMLGIIPSHYFRIEKYMSNLTLTQVIIISDNLKITTDWLLKGTEAPTETPEDLQKEITRLTRENKLLQMIVDQKHTP